MLTLFSFHRVLAWNTILLGPDSKMCHETALQNSDIEVQYRSSVSGIRICDM